MAWRRRRTGEGDSQRLAVGDGDEGRGWSGRQVCKHIYTGLAATCIPARRALVLGAVRLPAVPLGCPLPLLEGKAKRAGVQGRLAASGAATRIALGRRAAATSGTLTHTGSLDATGQPQVLGHPHPGPTIKPVRHSPCTHSSSSCCFIGASDIIGGGTTLGPSLGLDMVRVVVGQVGTAWRESG